RQKRSHTRRKTHKILWNGEFPDRRSILEKRRQSDWRIGAPLLGKAPDNAVYLGVQRLVEGLGVKKTCHFVQLTVIKQKRAEKRLLQINAIREIGLKLAFMMEHYSHSWIPNL